MTSARFPDDVRSPQAARAFVRGQIAGCVDSTMEASVLLVSELVTNAVLHARSSVLVEVLQLTCGRIRIEVSDSSPQPPVTRSPSLSASSGRGVGLVAAVSTRWGVRLLPIGKTVWFEVDPQPA